MERGFSSSDQPEMNSALPKTERDQKARGTKRRAVLRGPGEQITAVIIPVPWS